MVFIATFNNISVISWRCISMSNRKFLYLFYRLSLKLILSFNFVLCSIADSVINGIHFLCYHHLIKL